MPVLARAEERPPAVDERGAAVWLSQLTLSVRLCDYSGVHKVYVASHPLQ